MSEKLAQNPAEQQLSQEQWGKAFVAMEALSLERDVAARADQVSQITGEGIMEVAKKLHTVLAPDMSHEPTPNSMHIQSPDGTNRRELAKPEDREQLFDHAAELIRQMASNRAVDQDSNFLKRAGNVAALSVVLGHSFEDANGRTARTMAHLIREGFDPENEVLKSELQTVGSNRPDIGFRIYSFLPTNDGLNLSPEALLDKAAALDVPLGQHDQYINRRDQYFTSPYTD